MRSNRQADYHESTNDIQAWRCAMTGRRVRCWPAITFVTAIVGRAKRYRRLMSFLPLNTRKVRVQGTLLLGGRGLGRLRSQCWMMFARRLQAIRRLQQPPPRPSNGQWCLDRTFALCGGKSSSSSDTVVARRWRSRYEGDGGQQRTRRPVRARHALIIIRLLS